MTQWSSAAALSGSSSAAASTVLRGMSMVLAIRSTATFTCSDFATVEPRLPNPAVRAHPKEHRPHSGLVGRRQPVLTPELFARCRCSRGRELSRYGTLLPTTGEVLRPGPRGGNRVVSHSRRFQRSRAGPLKCYDGPAHCKGESFHSLRPTPGLGKGCSLIHTVQGRIVLGHRLRLDVVIGPCGEQPLEGGRTYWLLSQSEIRIYQGTRLMPDELFVVHQWLLGGLELVEEQMRAHSRSIGSPAAILLGEGHSFAAAETTCAVRRHLRFRSAAPTSRMRCTRICGLHDVGREGSS